MLVSKTFPTYFIKGKMQQIFRISFRRGLEFISKHQNVLRHQLFDKMS